MATIIAGEAGKGILELLLTDYIGYTITAAIVLLGMFFALFYFAMYWWDIREKHPEMKVIKECRDKKTPLVIIADASERLMFYVLEKENKHDMPIKTDVYGIKIDGRYGNTTPNSRLVDGVPVFMYSIPFHLPVGVKGLTAFKQAIQVVRERIPEFEIISDDLVLMTLLYLTGTDLEEYANKVLKVSNPKSPSSKGYVAKDKFLKAIENGKKIITTQNIRPGYFSISEGIRSIPVAAGSTVVKTIVDQAREQERNEQRDDLERWIKIASAVMLVLFGMGFAVYIAGM